MVVKNQISKEEKKRRLRPQRSGGADFFNQETEFIEYGEGGSEMSIGANIRRKREEQKLTQEQLVMVPDPINSAWQSQRISLK